MNRLGACIRNLRSLASINAMDANRADTPVIDIKRDGICANVRLSRLGEAE